MLFKKNWGDFKFDVKDWEDWYYTVNAVVRTAWVSAALYFAPAYRGTGPIRIVAAWYDWYTTLSY